MNEFLNKLDIKNDNIDISYNLYSMICNLMPHNKIFIGMDRFYGTENPNETFDDIMDKIFLNNKIEYFPITINLSNTKKLKGILFGAYIYPAQISNENFDILLNVFSEITIVLSDNSVDEIINYYTKHNFNKMIFSNLSIVYAFAIHENHLAFYYDNRKISEKNVLSYFEI